MVNACNRATALVVSGFIAVTAIGGGIGLLAGAEAERFPAEWLTGTPFSTYLIPGLLLAIVVGGSSLVAWVSVLRRWATAAWWVLAAGVAMVAWIVGEVVVYTADGTGFSATEVFYLLAGALLAVTGWSWRHAGSVSACAGRPEGVHQDGVP